MGVKSISIAALLLSGCASIEYSSPGKLTGIEVKGAAGQPSQLVRVKTASFHMFWTLPIAAGNVCWDPVKRDVKGGVSWGADFAGAEEVQSTLLKLAESRNSDLVDFQIDWGDQSFAGVSYQGAVGTCFGLSIFSATGILVPRAGGAK